MDFYVSEKVTFYLLLVSYRIVTRMNYSHSFFCFPLVQFGLPEWHAPLSGDVRVLLLLQNVDKTPRF